MFCYISEPQYLQDKVLILHIVDRDDWDKVAKNLAKLSTFREPHKTGLAIILLVVMLLKSGQAVQHWKINIKERGKYLYNFIRMSAI